MYKSSHRNEVLLPHELQHTLGRKQGGILCPQRCKSCTFKYQMAFISNKGMQVWYHCNHVYCLQRCTTMTKHIPQHRLQQNYVQRGLAMQACAGSSQSRRPQHMQVFEGGPAHTNKSRTGCPSLNRTLSSLSWHRELTRTLLLAGVLTPLGAIPPRHEPPRGHKVHPKSLQDYGCLN
jgi:hypothetical protein